MMFDHISPGAEHDICRGEVVRLVTLLRDASLLLVRYMEAQPLEPSQADLNNDIKAWFENLSDAILGEQEASH